MKEFFDTSVLIAAFRTVHPNHLASIERFAKAEPRRSACAAHTLAEFYAVTTTLPLRPMILPEQAMLFVDETRSRLSIVALTPDEYSAAIQDLADRGIGGGRIYDALLLTCAAKCNAETIYTWNVKHFQALAPRMATRIRTP